MRIVLSRVRRIAQIGAVGVLGSAIVYVALAATNRITTGTRILGPIGSFFQLPLDKPHRTFIVSRVVPVSRPSFSNILVGFSSPNGPYDLARIRGIEHAIGKHAAIVEIGQAFDEPLDGTGLKLARSHDSLPMLTWYLWSTAYGRHGGSKKPEPRFALRTIIQGKHDAYIRAFARAARRDGNPILLRFAPEMNGFWYPWSTAPTGNIRGENRNKNQRGEFVLAWRHIHRIFDSERATNVIWDWSPNVLFYGQKYPLREFFPGDRWVDVVGPDGYNWGRVKNWSKWLTPEEIFDKTLRQLRTLTKRPFIINEVASTEIGGDKAAWVGDFLSYVARQPDVVGFVWFNWDKETDWRFVSSPASRRTFFESLQSSRFSGHADALLGRLRSIAWRRRPLEAKKHPCHPLHLRLLGSTVAADRLSNARRRVTGRCPGTG